MLLMYCLSFWHTPHSVFVFILFPPPPPSTLFPYTTLFRSRRRRGHSDYHRNPPSHEPITIKGTTLFAIGALVTSSRPSPAATDLTNRAVHQYAIATRATHVVPATTCSLVHLSSRFR